MKKFLSLILALVLVLSMATVAFADDETPATGDGKVTVDTTTDGGKTKTEDVTMTDVSSVVIKKVYNATNEGTTSPAETFEFTKLTCISVADAGVNVTTTNAPVPTIGTADYAAGEAGSETKEKEITISLPTYTAVGIYTYTFSEVDGETAGVTYRPETIKLVVTVLQDEPSGKVRVAAVHTEKEGAAKSGTFENIYSAGTLEVSKEVTGILADQTKEFPVKVTFFAPEGDTVREAITYVEDGVTKTVAGGWDDTAAADIMLKHGETIKFTNIPYGVTYTVVETVPSDYEAAKYTFSDGTDVTTGEIKDGSAFDTVKILNTKNGTVDTGISMDTVPYIVLLAAAVVGMIALVAKKRAREF